MDTTELTLKWEKFGLSRGLHEMLGAGELVDVTIACQGEFLQAHKTVLAACSQQFRQIFMMNPCQHPVVFMQDVQLPHLQALLSFMYTGEATIGQDELPALLRTAQALRVSGLASASKGLLESEQTNSKDKTAAERESSSQPTPSPPPPSKRARRSSGWRETMPPLQQAPRQVPTPPPRTNIQPPSLLQPSDIKLEDEISLEEAGEDDWPPDVEAIAPEPHFTMDQPHQGGPWFDAGPSTSGQPQPGTSQDGNGHTVNSIARVVKKCESKQCSPPDKEQENDDNKSTCSYSCDQCGKTCKKPTTLMRHKRNYHSRKCNVCQLCNKNYSTPGNLTTHQRYVHGLLKSVTCCPRCGVDCRNVEMLMLHVSMCASHELRATTCEECGKTFKHLKSLKEHMIQFHADSTVRYPCTLCDSSFKISADLLKHISKYHPDI